MSATKTHSAWWAQAWSSHRKTTVVTKADTYSGIRIVAECEEEAEARLISAVQELLAFAQEFLEDYQSEDGMNSMKHYAKKAHEAISKASGGAA